MPVVDTERATSPRSALRYRPLHTDQARPGQSASRRRSDVQTSTASQIADDLPLEEDDTLPTRSRPSRSSARRTALPRRVQRRVHPLLWLGVSLTTLVLLWTGITQVVTWSTNKLNDWRYGYPRVFQMDAVLGHQDSAAHPTHLLALNLKGEIILEEFPGGEVSKAKRYVLTSLVGTGSDLLPVTLQLLEREGHAGHPDLIVDVGGTLSLLVNDQGSFRPPTPAERQQLLLLLQARE